MNRNIKVAVAQMNSHVGSIDYNLSKIIKFINLGKNKKVDLLCFPELAFYKFWIAHYIGNIFIFFLNFFDR